MPLSSPLATQAVVDAKVEAARVAALPAATTLAALASIAAAINTAGKFKNRLADDENDRTWKALGAEPASKWRPLDDQSGLSDITPA